MNNIILYQTNEHIFLNFYRFTGFGDIFDDKNFKNMSGKIKKENKTIDGEIINKDKDEL